MGPYQNRRLGGPNYDDVACIQEEGRKSSVGRLDQRGYYKNKAAKAQTRRMLKRRDKAEEQRQRETGEAMSFKYKVKVIFEKPTYEYSDVIIERDHELTKDELDEPDWYFTLTDEEIVIAKAALWKPEGYELSEIEEIEKL